MANTAILFLYSSVTSSWAGNSSKSSKSSTEMNDLFSYHCSWTCNAIIHVLLTVGFYSTHPLRIWVIQSAFYVWFGSWWFIFTESIDELMRIVSGRIELVGRNSFQVNSMNGNRLQINELRDGEFNTLTNGQLFLIVVIYRHPTTSMTNAKVWLLFIGITWENSRPKLDRFILCIYIFLLLLLLLLLLLGRRLLLVLLLLYGGRDQAEYSDKECQDKATKSKRSRRRRRRRRRSKVQLLRILRAGYCRSSCPNAGHLLVLSSQLSFKSKWGKSTQINVTTQFINQSYCSPRPHPVINCITWVLKRK